MKFIPFLVRVLGARPTEPAHGDDIPPSETGELTQTGDDSDRYLGCGWFDSSHELQRGLAVFEGEAVELAAAVARMLCPERAGA